MKIRRNKLDILFSEFIRWRDGGTCQRCGAYKGIKGVQCAHFHSRRKQSTRYDEDNCISLCFGCHQYFHENPDRFKEWFKNRLGEDKFNMLLGRMRNTWPKPDKKLIEIYLRERLKEGLND